MGSSILGSRSAAAWSLLIGLVTALPAHGQAVVIRAVPIQGAAIQRTAIQVAPVQPAHAAGTVVAPVVTPAQGGAADPADLSSGRIEKIKKLLFDRRPSALLGAGAEGEATTTRAAEAPAPATTDPFDLELKAFREAALAGRWEAVATFLQSLPAAEATAALDRLLEQLATLPQPPPGPTGVPLPPEFPAIGAADVVGIARLLPVGAGGGTPPDENRRRQLGSIARLALDGGTEGEDLAAALMAEMRREGSSLDLASAAGILADAGRADLAGPLLPPLDEAVGGRDTAAIKLRVKQLRAARSRDPKSVSVAELWEATEALVAATLPDTPDRRFAIEQAAELLPSIPKAQAEAWLAKVTGTEADTGSEFVRAIAARVATGPSRHPHEIEPRAEWLQLLHRAVAGATGSAVADDPRFAAVLVPAARAWTAEAKLSAEHDTRDAGMRRDPYGNVYYWEEQQLQMQRMQLPQWPVKLADVIAAAPDEAWLSRLPAAERPAVDRAIVAIHCKAGEVDKALPALERLAAAHPAAAKTLVRPLLDAWKLSHDPNDERVRPMPFFYAFGMDQRQGGIPLSRSLQERNLAELEALVGRLRGLPVGPLDEALLVECFTTCHSAAEVWQPAAILRVFGATESLSPTAVALLAGRMRANLAGTWQQPSVQEQKKTKRREADIRAEVEKGYATARDFVAGALERHPGHWALTGAEAALDHDENDFRRKLADSPDFTKNRRAALDRFAEAARAYAAATAALPRDAWNPDLLDTWFLAGLGACDAKRIDETTQAVAGESARLKEVIESMEPEPRQWHRERFATALVSRLAQVNPAVKHRVVREGLVVAGDEPKAREAKQVFDYYCDLIREIELRADIDGPDRVGTGRPFGVLVSLRHTREIEREAGGFGRYLQNQKANTAFAFNFGRPLENYRDKFEEMVRRTLGEFFEVKSVTFQTEDVQSRADAEYGWRRTPYAYLVLAAKDAKVDRLPPLRLDLDFLDTAGHVILPIESNALGLDAATAADPRPFANLTLTEILDERKAREGELNLEIRATARGLVPDLATILDAAPVGYEVKGVRDDGLSVARFDPDSSAPVVLSERSWVVNLVPGASADGRFHFPEPKVEVAERTLQRYDDADLIAAEPAVTVGKRLTGRLLTWPRVAAGLAGLAILVALGVALRTFSRRGPVAIESFVVPDPATPFAVLQLLRDIQSTNGLDPRGHAQLQESIDRIETGYFAAGAVPQAGELEQLARSWVAKARPRSGATEPS